MNEKLISAHRNLNQVPFCLQKLDLEKLSDKYYLSLKYQIKPAYKNLRVENITQYLKEVKMFKKLVITLVIVYISSASQVIYDFIISRAIHTFKMRIDFNYSIWHLCLSMKILFHFSSLGLRSGDSWR